jgi:hypothetical protein
MSKFIIHSDNDIDDMTMIKLLSSTIEEGKISKTNYGEQYCFLIHHENFLHKNKNYKVSAKMNKIGTHTFKIWRTL